MLTTQQIEQGSPARWSPELAAFPAVRTSPLDLGREPRRSVPPIDPAAANRDLSNADATRVIEWAADSFGDGLSVSTSFGIHSAVFLDLVTRVVPNVPVIWIDTGYLPEETLRFADELRERLNLNLHTYRSLVSPEQMEREHGRLWQRDDVAALNLYDRIRKVEPMQRALRELGVTGWLAGLRADQTEHRGRLPRVAREAEHFKLLPLLHWTTRDLHAYLRANGLPHHPLFEQGYATVGDWHSSRPLSPDDEHERDSRFRGLKQECGLHIPELPDTPGLAESLTSSQL